MQSSTGLFDSLFAELDESPGFWPGASGEASACSTILRWKTLSRKSTALDNALLWQFLLKIRFQDTRVHDFSWQNTMVAAHTSLSTQPVRS
jgi:hypothetical protein